MPAQHKFSVKADKDSTTHSVVASVTTFAEATDAQKRTMWEEGMAAATVKVQGTLRRRLEKGVRGEALNTEATRAFKSIIDNTVISAAPVVDAKANGLNAAQCAALEAAGVVVLNKPEPKQDK